ncbi:MAG: hypothetical protein EXS13_10935 [Planctomycetes bacterium]|nr:hypothetical protein [Planctomycetota bacterium]
MGRRAHALGSVAVVCVRYPAHPEQPTHEHEAASRSFVVEGGLVESAGGRDWAAVRGDEVAKPAEWRHADRYGAAGATMIAIAPMTEVDGPPWRADAAGCYGWHRAPGRMRRIVALWREAAASGRASAADNVTSSTHALDLEERALELLADPVDRGPESRLQCGALRGAPPA